MTFLHKYRILTVALVCSIATLGARAQHVETKVEKAEIVYVEGNDVVVKFNDGEVRLFEIPETHTFTIDGKDIALRELKPGMMLTATITTAKPPRWVDTVKIIDVGTVWKTIGSNLIITTPAGKNEMYRVPAGGKITIDGKDKTLDQLHEGDNITATVVSTRPLTALDGASGTVRRVISTPPRVGALLIDEGAVVEEPSGTHWSPAIVGAAILLVLIVLLFLLALRRRRRS